MTLCDPLCAVPRPEPPVQVHHHAQDVAAAERVDVVDDCEKRDIKTASPKRVVGQMIEHGTRTQTIGCFTFKDSQTTTVHDLQSRGGISPGVLIGIDKASYAITKALGDHQRKQATKISLRRMQEVGQGKRKKYAGESFSCCIM